MTDLGSLIEELEKAEEGSRELSNDALFACGWTIKQYESRRKKVPHDWITPNGKGVVAYGEQPDPTRNIKDAIDWVVPKGCAWGVTSRCGTSPPVASCGPKAGPIQSGKAFTPALALCIAALRARRE